MLAVLRGEVEKATRAQNVTTQDLLERRYESVTRDITVSAATSGNHGRALAWGAQQSGCRCVVLHERGGQRRQRSRHRGVRRGSGEVPGSFDEAVRRSFADAMAAGQKERSRAFDIALQTD